MLDYSNRGFIVETKVKNDENGNGQVFARSMACPEWQPEEHSENLRCVSPEAAMEAALLHLTRFRDTDAPTLVSWGGLPLDTHGFFFVFQDFTFEVNQ